MSTARKDFLIAAPAAWSEATFAVPAVRAMLATGLGIGVLCRESAAEFWRTLPGLNVISVGVRDNKRKIAERIGSEWQASIAWEPGDLAQAMARAGIGKRLGVSSPKLDSLLTDPVSAEGKPGDHRVKHYLGVPDALGIPTGKAEFFEPAALGVEPVEKAVLLVPGSDFGAAYEWPLERWEEVAQQLLDAGMRITVADVASQSQLGSQLAAKLGDDKAELFVAQPLAATLPLLAVHGLTVAVEGSLPHLASYAGSTCVTIFGPGDSFWTRPLGRRHRVVARKVECSPCLLAKCPLDHRCMAELEVSQVWSAIQSAL